MPRPGGWRGVVVALCVLALVLTGLWWLQSGGGVDDSGTGERATGSAETSTRPSHDYTATTTPSTTPTATPTASPPGGPSGETDPASGLPVVAVADLPAEARDVLGRIDDGGPFKYPDDDGGTFENREDLLPDRPMGYYREYTVESGPGDRGPMRIVTGDGGEAYWTDDHYRSFSRIAR